MSTPYQPDAEAARLAPAAVCNTVSRIYWLRAKLHEFAPDAQRMLAPFVAPFPFEEELMSGNMERVDAAIKRLGALDDFITEATEEDSFIESLRGRTAE